MEILRSKSLIVNTWRSKRLEEPLFLKQFHTSYYLTFFLVFTTPVTESWCDQVIERNKKQYFFILNNTM